MLLNNVAAMRAGARDRAGCCGGRAAAAPAQTVHR